jgi:hypothetical protein
MDPDPVFQGWWNHEKLLVDFSYLKSAINIQPLYCFFTRWTELARRSATRPAQPHVVLSLTGGTPASD